ncbi:YdcH family protein [Roseateles chitinivorans]|uniref:YdcH family protein n=1 Tax=Roseateles chitinivorans TaxID=2917965 RepID=UPI003D6779C2
MDGRIDALMGSLRVEAVDAVADIDPGRTVAAISTLATPIAGGRAEPPVDELTLRRLKKQRLALRDEIARLERASDPDEPA